MASTKNVLSVDVVVSMSDATKKCWNCELRPANPVDGLCNSCANHAIGEMEQDAVKASKCNFAERARSLV